MLPDGALAGGRASEPRGALPDEEIQRAIVSKIPLGRFGQPDEIADACSYLVSDYAGYVTGAVLTIDGGMWLDEGAFGMIGQ